MPASARWRTIAPLVGAALLSSWIGFTSSASAATYEVDRAASLFAVVTHKAGFASGLAHNHLVVADRVAVTAFEFDPGAPAAARFEATVEAAGLEVDRRADQDRWQARVLALDILQQPFTHPGDSDRQKIRHDMLAAGQLDAARHPKIVARVAGLAPPAAGAREKLPWKLHLELALHGKTIVRDIPASIDVAADGTLTGEAAGEYTYTEFGIPPFSAFLGAVKNEDRFHVLVHLVAKARP